MEIDEQRAVEEHHNIHEERPIKRAIALGVALEHDGDMSAAAQAYNKILGAMGLDHDDHAKKHVSHWHSQYKDGNKILADGFRPGRPVKVTGFSGEQLAEMLTRNYEMGGHTVPFYSMADAKEHIPELEEWADMYGLSDRYIWDRAKRADPSLHFRKHAKGHR